MFTSASASCHGMTWDPPQNNSCVLRGDYHWIASNRLSKQTVEQRGSCLVLLITVDCMLKLWWDVLVEGCLSGTSQAHMQEHWISNKWCLCKQLLQAPQQAHLDSHSWGMMQGAQQVPLRRWLLLSLSSRPIWKTKWYASSSLWQVPSTT